MATSYVNDDVVDEILAEASASSSGASSTTSAAATRVRKVSLIEPKGVKSWVWKHMKIYDTRGLAMNNVLRNCAHCTECDEDVNYGQSKSTSALVKHMVSKHRAIYDAQLAADVAAQSQLKKRNYQSTLDAHVSHDSKQEDKLIKFIVHSYQPFSVVNCPYFRAYVQSLNVNARIFDRGFIGTAIAKIATDVQCELKGMLSGQYYALTTDHWTSKANESYMATTVHFIDANWKLIATTLSCSVHKESQTAENTLGFLREACDKFDLPQSHLVATVTDSAANMNLTGMLLDQPHHYCVAHVIELTTKKVCKQAVLENVLKAARGLVGHFKGSALATEALLKKQENYFTSNGSSEQPKRVIQDVATRWWSTYAMLDRLLELKPFFQMMQQYDGLNCNLSDSQWSIASNLVVSLKPFMVLQQFLEGEHYVTNSVIPFLLNAVRGRLNAVSSSGMNASVVEALTQLKIDFDERWGSGEDGTVFDENATRTRGNRQKGIPSKTLLAAALDPRTKGLHGIPVNDQGKIWKAITEDCINFASPPDATGAIAAATPAAATSATAAASTEPVEIDDDDDIFAELSNTSATTSAARTVVETLDVIVAREIDAYRAAPSLPMKERSSTDPAKTVYSDPLAWWKANQLVYPHVAPMARRLLCIPATSAPSERVFSVAGGIITDNRCRLLPENAENSIFLHDTWPLIEEYRSNLRKQG